MRTSHPACRMFVRENSSNVWIPPTLMWFLGLRLLLQVRRSGSCSETHTRRTPICGQAKCGLSISKSDLMKSLETSEELSMSTECVKPCFSCQLSGGSCTNGEHLESLLASSALDTTSEVCNKLTLCQQRVWQRWKHTISPKRTLLPVEGCSRPRKQVKRLKEDSVDEWDWHFWPKCEAMRVLTGWKL